MGPAPGWGRSPGRGGPPRGGRARLLPPGFTVNPNIDPYAEYSEYAYSEHHTPDDDIYGNFNNPEAEQGLKGDQCPGYKDPAGAAAVAIVRCVQY